MCNRALKYMPCQIKIAKLHYAANACFILKLNKNASLQIKTTIIHLVDSRTSTALSLINI